MSIDERDYYNESQQYRDARLPVTVSSSALEDEYWRLVSQRQQAKFKLFIFLGVFVLAMAIYFRGEVVDFFRQASGASHQTDNAELATPTQSTARTNPQEQPFPVSGSIIRYQKNSTATAKFTVISGAGKQEHCVVKLDTWKDGVPTFEIFVKAGERAETQLVPLGEYRVKYACGTHWYGRLDMFGKGTVVSVGTTPLKFTQQGNTTSGHELTLTKVFNGNFRTNDSYFNKF